MIQTNLLPSLVMTNFIRKVYFGDLSSVILIITKRDPDHYQLYFVNHSFLPVHSMCFQFQLNHSVFPVGLLSWKQHAHSFQIRQDPQYWCYCNFFCDLHSRSFSADRGTEYPTSSIPNVVNTQRRLYPTLIRELGIGDQMP